MKRRQFLTGILGFLAAGAALGIDDAQADHNRPRRPRRRRRRPQRDGSRSRPPRNGPRPRGFYQDGPPPGQDRARRALREGRVLPLGDILDSVRRRIPGKVLDVDLVQEGRGFVYHLRVLVRDGRVLGVAVDGRSARILGVRGRKR